MTGSGSAAEFSRYLDAIVELTRCHSPQELAATLLKTLRAMVPAQRLRLLAITNDEREAEFYERNLENAALIDVLDAERVPPCLLAADADLLACVRRQQAVGQDAPGRRLVFPIFGARYVRELLVIEGLRAALPYDLLAKLLQVYGNQAFMLLRGELDPLTGLFNRQSFYERIRRVAQGADSQRRAADNAETPHHCFAFFDIDYFKRVNDQYGHLYGDEVLLLLARLMTHSFRHDDLLFRYGGEEFAVVLVNVDLDNAERLLERFRGAVESYAFPRLEPKTISIGVTAVDMKQGIDRIVMCADKALYYAKNHGRNRVCCYEKLVAAGKLEPVIVAEGDIEFF